MSKVLFDRLSLPILSLSTPSLSFRALSSSFSSSLISTLFYSLQASDFVSRIYIFQHLVSSSRYFSLLLLLHSTFAPASHRSSPTIQMLLSKFCTFFFARLVFSDIWLKKRKRSFANPCPSSRSWTALLAKSKHSAPPHLRLSQN